MAATPGEDMRQTSGNEAGRALMMNHLEPSKSRCGEERDRCAPDSPQEVKDLMPYAAKEYSAKGVAECFMRPDYRKLLCLFWGAQDSA